MKHVIMSLTYLQNKPTEEGIFPDVIKLAMVFQLKSQITKFISDYWFITVLSVLALF